MEIRECLAGLLVSGAEGRFSGVVGDGEGDGDGDGLCYPDLFLLRTFQRGVRGPEDGVGLFCYTVAVAICCGPTVFAETSRLCISIP